MSSYSDILTCGCHGSAGKKGAVLENNLKEDEEGEERERGKREE